ncbi:MAG: cytochrome c [Myxococcales bacterium]|nr:cytochrome c [Polyangiaceae bacterium]MDW8248613.1 cytochrome c [Myxococcales bacterium]
MDLSQDPSTHPNPSPPHIPSSRLLASALIGLLGLSSLPACGEEPSDNALPNEAAGASGAAGSADIGGDAGASGAASQGGQGQEKFSKTVSTTPITYEEFLAKCDEWGGFVQTHAVCGGNNACKGYSYLEPTLTEHSCRGMNSCGPGMSCVVLPPDGGQTGQQIYEETGACASMCHGSGGFALHVRPGTVTLEQAKERFLTGPRRRLESIVAFGVTGLNEDGVAQANMPPYHTKFSRAEIVRVVDYIRTLPVTASFYEIPGGSGDLP